MVIEISRSSTENFPSENQQLDFCPPGGGLSPPPIRQKKNAIELKPFFTFSFVFRIF